MQDWARRTVAIFGYPKDSNTADVTQHAHAFGSQFGKVIGTNMKYGSGRQPYAIVNFETMQAAQAAVLHHPKPRFQGALVSPKAWNLPSQRPSSGCPPTPLPLPLIGSA